MRRRICTVAVIAACLVAGATPANAHPFGPPPTARVQAEGRRVIIDWASAPDDAIAIGEQLGVLPEGSTEAFRGGVTQVAPPAEAEAELAASPLLRDYLRERIRVSQDGARCAARVGPITDFVNDGARVVATCPVPVTTAELSIEMLTDIHSAYRTFAVGQNTTPQQFVYTVDAPSQVWDFTGARRRQAALVPPVVAGTGAAVIVVAALWLILRRRSRADQRAGERLHP